jgi:hypothetical protein
MKFDAFLATVGDWGKFQKVKYTLICLTYMLPPIMVYTYTFTAATPNFRCESPRLIPSDEYNLQSNEIYKLMYQPTKALCDVEQKKLSTKECQRCFIRQNQTRSDRQLVKCDNFVFEKLHYEKTLVEEVTLISKF